MKKIIAAIVFGVFCLGVADSVHADGTKPDDAGTTILVVPTDFCDAGDGYVALRTPEWNDGQVILHMAVFLPGMIVHDYENIIGTGATANYGFSYVGDDLQEAVQVILYAEYVTSENVFTSENVGIDMDKVCLTVVAETPVVIQPAPAPPLEPAPAVVLPQTS